MKKLYFICFLFLFSIINSKAQTTLHSTDIICPYSGDANWEGSSTTFILCGTNAPVSTGYTGASAGNNIRLRNNGGALERTYTFQGVSTIGYSTVNVLFGSYRSSAGTHPTAGYRLEYSTNGSTWYHVETINSSIDSWSLVNSGNGIDLPIGATNVANLQIRFIFNPTSSGTAIFLIDDIRIIGFCSEPTSHSSDVNDVTGGDDSYLFWTKGNGARRIVVIREGAAVSFVPMMTILDLEKI
jgi:hypothetical protein